jgi:hypothetical protein
MLLTYTMLLRLFNTAAFLSEVCKAFKICNYYKRFIASALTKIPTDVFSSARLMPSHLFDHVLKREEFE